MRRTAWLMILTVAAVSACGKRREATSAADLAELAAMCKQQVCRPATAVHIPIDATHVYEVPFPASPYIAAPGIVSDCR